MALARGVKVRDHHAFEQRKATVEAILDHLAPIRGEDGGKLEDVRRFEVVVDSPGAPFAAKVRFRYLEWWTSEGRGWRRAKYQYDYIDLVHRSRLAYHRHDLAGEPDLHHIHCEPSGGRRLARHFRAYEVDLLEAHEDFVALYVSGQVIDCAGLRPLQATQEGADA